MGSPVTDAPKSSPGHGGARPGAGRKPDAALNASYQQLAKAKAKRETFKAHTAELEYKEKAGQLIAAERVAELWRMQIETAKGRLLALPGGIAQELLRKKSAAEIEQALREALMGVMEEIASAEL